MIDFSDAELYIIGNGFDLFHGLPTKYYDFKMFLDKKYKEIVCEIEKYYDGLLSQSCSHKCNSCRKKCLFWSDVEKHLFDINKDLLYDDIQERLHGYGEDDWKDSFYHEAQEHIQYILIDLLCDKLDKALHDWISSIGLTNTSEKLKLNKHANFITFNYTLILEAIYKIIPENIFHIHGSVENENLIFGFEQKTIKIKEQDKEYDFQEDSALNEIELYFKKRTKPVDRIINENGNYFKQMSRIKNIVVLGHSLSDVDKKYFEKIIGLFPRATWKFSYHSDRDKNTIGSFCKSIGIKSHSLCKL